MNHSMSLRSVEFSPSIIKRYRHSQEDQAPQIRIKPLAFPKESEKTPPASSQPGTSCRSSPEFDRRKMRAASGGTRSLRGIFCHDRNCVQDCILNSSEC